MGLIRKLAEYPRLIESAALQHEPHRLAFYLARSGEHVPHPLEQGHGDKRLTLC
jgi:hypothetical protein